MKKKLSLYLTSFFLVFGIALGLLKAFAMPEEFTNIDSYTYFGYEPHKISSLSSLTSHQTITEKMIQDEECFVDNYLTYREASFLEKLRLKTYLYAAQREFAFLSFSTKHHFEGDLHCLTEKIMRLFYPHFPKSSQKYDPFTEKLSYIVSKCFEKRLSEEKKFPNNYPTQQWIPWIAKPSIQYFPASYNRKEATNYAQEVLKTQKQSTPVEKEYALFWEGGCGLESGDWINIGNVLIFNEEKNLPLGKIILIRNLLSLALYDAEIAVHEAKEHFQIERPYQINPEIIPLGPKPSTSSFPSGHSALAGAASSILIHFFPEEREDLFELSHNASRSRIVAGMHTSIDLEEGDKMGKKIAHDILLNEWGVKEKASTQSSSFSSKNVRLTGGKYTPRPQCCSRKVLWQYYP